MVAKTKRDRQPLLERVTAWAQTMPMAEFVARYGVVLVLILLVALMTFLSPIIRGQ